MIGLDWIRVYNPPNCAVARRPRKLTCAAAVPTKRRGGAKERMLCACGRLVGT
jgi:hypothetical protein